MRAGLPLWRDQDAAGRQGGDKCDLCIERLAAGQEPACVAACPTGALRFSTAEEAAAQARKRAAGRVLAAARKGPFVEV